MPNPDDASTRYKASVADFDLTLSDYLNGIPTKISTKASGVDVPLREFGHVFVPPGLATHSRLTRGPTGRAAALFYTADQLVLGGNGLYLTPDSIELKNHCDTIAILETCELTSGPIHGHEAANPIRSPGRGPQGGLGRKPMWMLDPHSSESGNVLWYGSTPTPAVPSFPAIQEPTVARTPVTPMADRSRADALDILLGDKR